MVKGNKRHKMNTNTNPSESQNVKKPMFCGDIGSLTPFCMEKPILSWRRHRDNATFIIAGRDLLLLDASS
jgi:hypothetical protein